MLAFTTQKREIACQLLLDYRPFVEFNSIFCSSVAEFCPEIVTFLMILTEQSTKLFCCDYWQLSDQSNISMQNGLCSSHH